MELVEYTGCLCRICGAEIHGLIQESRGAVAGRQCEVGVIVGVEAEVQG